MTEADLELGRLRARLWRVEQEREMWERYAERLERQIRSLREAETVGVRSEDGPYRPLVCERS